MAGSRRQHAERLLCGVDIGGTKIQVVVTDTSFTRLGESRGPTPTAGGPPAVIDAVARLVRQAEAAAAGGGRVAAIGVGAPGTVDRSQGTVARSPNLAGWIDPYALGPELGRMVNARVVVDNDVRIGMLGEHRLGAARGLHDVLGVWFGTGVGGALVLGDELRRGRSGAAGEIGHVVVKSGGRRCGCGRKGCLEAYAGRASMERRARELARKGRKTELLEIAAQSGRDHLTSGVFARALARKDRLATQLIDRAVWAAGCGIASAVNVLDVEAVVIGGGLGTRLGSPFAERIEEAMQPHLFVDGAQSAQVLPAELGDYAGALGGASEAAGLLETR